MIESMGFTRQQAIAALEATVRSCDALKLLRSTLCDLEQQHGESSGLDIQSCR